MQVYCLLEREQQPQTLLFSATCPRWVSQTAKKYMRPENTEHVDTIGKDKVRTATTVQHLAIRCHYTQRSQCIGKIFRFARITRIQSVEFMLQFLVCFIVISLWKNKFHFAKEMQVLLLLSCICKSG